MKLKNNILFFITGIINGMFGAGGGSFLVPVMEKYLGIKAQRAHATALAVILPLSIVSLLFYVPRLRINWGLVGLVSLGGVVGGFLGSIFLKKISSKWLHRIFGICLVLAAVRMLWG